MKNLLDAMPKIGVLATERVAAEFPDIAAEVSTYLPYVDSRFVEDRIVAIGEAVRNMKEKTIFLITPEIALLEYLAERNWRGTALVAIPFDIDDESAKRIRHNIPRRVNVEFITEGFFPSNFRQSNGVIVCAGLTPKGYRPYIPHFSYRLMMMYKTFHGNRFLLSCSHEDSRVPELGWSFAEDDFFTDVIPFSISAA